MFPFDDVIMKSDSYLIGYADCKWLTWHTGCCSGGRIEGGRTWIKNNNNIAIRKRSIPLTGSKEGYSLHKLLFCMPWTASNAVCHLDNSISNWLFQVKQSVHITDLKFSCSPWTGYNFHEVSYGLLSSLMASRDIFCMLCICSSCKVSFDSTVKEICIQFVLCCGLLWFGKFHPYSSGLIHWHWGNHVIAPVPVKWLWKLWVNWSHESTMWIPISRMMVFLLSRVISDYSLKYVYLGWYAIYHMALIDGTRTWWSIIHVTILAIVVLYLLWLIFYIFSGNLFESGFFTIAWCYSCQC